MNDLADLMERVTTELHPDVTALVARGTATGRRLRTRRRLAMGSGALATAAAVGAVVLLAPTVVAGSADPAPPGTSLPAASPTASTRHLPTRAALATGSVVRLPAGRATLIDSRGDRDFVAAAWKFAPADGSPAARVDVLVQRVRMTPVLAGPEPTASLEELNDPAKMHEIKVGVGRMPTTTPRYTPSSYCHIDGGTCHALPDGSWANAFTGAEPLSGGGDSDIVSAHASVWTVDGFEIDATAYNAMGEKHVQPTRSAPVLDEDQLLAMVRAADLG